MNKLTIAEKFSLAVSCITLLSVLFAGAFWFYKTNELPKVTEIHEKRISQLEKQVAESTTKIDLIYQSVLEIRRVLLYK